MAAGSKSAEPTERVLERLVEERSEREEAELKRRAIERRLLYRYGGFAAVLAAGGVMFAGLGVLVGALWPAAPGGAAGEPRPSVDIQAASSGEETNDEAGQPDVSVPGPLELNVDVGEGLGAAVLDGIGSSVFDAIVDQAASSPGDAASGLADLYDPTLDFVASITDTFAGGGGGELSSEQLAEIIQAIQEQADGGGLSPEQEASLLAVTIAALNASGAASPAASQVTTDSAAVGSMTVLVINEADGTTTMTQLGD